MLFIFFTTEQADTLRNDTMGNDQALDPIPVSIGTYAGKEVLNANRVLNNTIFSDVIDILNLGVVLEIEPSDLWPEDE